jgi:hypothetical protein
MVATHGVDGDSDGHLGNSVRIRWALMRQMPPCGVFAPSVLVRLLRDHATAPVIPFRADVVAAVDLAGLRLH